MKMFFAKYHEFKHRPIYLMGESYAGHYIPAIANHIYHTNSGFELAGVAIGNGWVDPFYQYPQYGEYAHEHKMVEDAQHIVLRVFYEVC
jgi:carboxypeptidase C (cathepsin A)